MACNRPRRRGMGSAIFLHLMRRSTENSEILPTDGCVGLDARDLLMVLQIEIHRAVFGFVTETARDLQGDRETDARGCIGGLIDGYFLAGRDRQARTGQPLFAFELRQ